MYVELIGGVHLGVLGGPNGGQEYKGGAKFRKFDGVEWSKEEQRGF